MAQLGLPTLLSSGFPAHGLNVSVRNTFLHYADPEKEDVSEDGDDDADQPCLLRARTAPVARASVEDFERGQKSRCATVMPTLDEHTVRDEDLDAEADFEPSLPHVITRDAFDFDSPQWSRDQPATIGTSLTPDFGIRADSSAKAYTGRIGDSRGPAVGDSLPADVGVPRKLDLGSQVLSSSLQMPVMVVPTFLPGAQEVRAEAFKVARLADAVAPPSPGAATAGDAAAGTAAPGRTTVMMRNLPNNYTRAALLDLIGAEGFEGRYNFLYFPIDFRTHAALGYAFLNLNTAEDAEAFRVKLDGFCRWSLPSNKVCSVGWSHPHQGLDSHVARYRNSPLMHEAVPDGYRPILFKDGKRIPFPPPTKKIKPPRQGTERMLV